MVRSVFVLHRPSPRALGRVASALVGAWLVAASAAADEPIKPADTPVDPTVVAAAKAFAQAQEAELGGEHAHAAELFELADRIAPTPEALRSATRARLHAGQLAAAAGHAEELLRRYGSDNASHELAEQVLTRSRPELTRFRLHCESPCTVVVDGLASGLAPTQSQLLYASPGSHEFVVAFEGGLERSMRLSGERGEALAIRVQRPAKGTGKQAAASAASTEVSSEAQAVPSEPAKGGGTWLQAHRTLSPVYFWSTLAATAVVGGVAVWSGVDLMHARDDFEHDPDPTQADFDRGERKDLRTGLLIGGASALAIGSAVLAVFTDFRAGSRERTTASVGFDGQRAHLILQTAF